MSGFDNTGTFQAVSGAFTAFSGQVIASATWNAINTAYDTALSQVAQNQILRTPVTLNSAGTSYTVAALDNIIFVKANTPNIVLPACASKLCPVTIYGANTGIFNSSPTTLVANGAETINGSATQVMTVQYESITLMPMSTGGYSANFSEVSFGTVTSVALALPNIFTTSGSPVTTSGTLTGSLATQLPNLVWASSSSGATAAPTFRAIVNADLPGTATTGISFTSYNGGTISTGTVTPVASNSNYQYYINNGAHTLATPSTDTAINILVTNAGSAGTITFSGYTVGTTGDSMTTTNGNKFLISIQRINSVATYIVKALQ